MRVRVTNFTSVATVDFPLVLISGCVDNYSDQVILLPEKCIELMQILNHLMLYGYVSCHSCVLCWQSGMVEFISVAP